MSLASSTLDLTVDDKATGKLGRIEKAMVKVQAGFERVAQKAKIMAIAIGVAMGYAAYRAGDAQEVINKFDAVFGKQAESAAAFADDVAEALHRSDVAIKESMGTFQAFFKGMGYGGEDAMQLSKKLQMLAMDYASFHNLNFNEAAQKFISAFSGSSEVLMAQGINLKEASVAQELLRMGIDKTTTTVTEQHKVMARMNIIMRTMGEQGATGDAIKTVNTFTARLRQLRDQLDKVAVVLGTAVLPMLESFLGYIIPVIQGTVDWVKANQENVIMMLKWTGAILGILIIMPKLIGALRAVITALRVLWAAKVAVMAMGGPAGIAMVLAGGLAAAAAIAGTAHLWDQLGDSIDKARKKTEGFGKGAEEARKRLQDEMEKPLDIRLPGGDPAAKAREKAEEDLRGILDDLNEQYQILRMGKDKWEEIRLAQEGASEAGIRQLRTARAMVEALKSRAKYEKEAEESAKRVEEEKGSVRKSMRTPVEEMMDEMKRLNLMFNFGADDPETYARAVAAAQEKLRGTTQVEPRFEGLTAAWKRMQLDALKPKEEDLAQKVRERIAEAAEENARTTKELKQQEEKTTTATLDLREELDELNSWIRTRKKADAKYGR